jgi:site-specific DNA-methyltransferase (adenine-specific)
MATDLKVGDCSIVLKDYPDNYFSSIVTDPPYGLAFMGKKWDYDIPSVEIWKECLRVLKPGGHLLAFGGTRTYHRLVVAIEDAGFEIRDQIQWLYGQGFPKSMDISKAIDKEAGLEREVLGKRTDGRYGSSFNSHNSTFNEERPNTAKIGEITVPATPEAKLWQGWGTALKPANEPICLARKPLSEKTIAKNVLKWGTGGINIDETRIGTEIIPQYQRDFSEAHNNNLASGTKQPVSGVTNYTVGRFPSNIILDEDAALLLDDQSGFSISKVGGTSGKSRVHNLGLGVVERGGHNDSGGASRFFYVAKASKADRGEGNTHPTVKPIKLMEYLVKLITPKGGIVLDPFMGSGSTGVAASNLGFSFCGIDSNEDYVAIASKRILI